MDTPSHTPKKVKVAVPAKALIQAGVAIVLVIVSFYGGVAYQKSKKTIATDTGNLQQMGGQGFGNGGGQFGPGGGRQMMTVSEVTAISSTSITINGNGESKTYTINDSTSISKDGAIAAASDITVGDNVAVMASSSETSVARRIIINPQQGGMMMNGPQSDVQTN
ncbi:MAG TPA: hypothetical protein VLA92_02035 [Candidatus Saccharimonadales bacterium]|nr:hypothetical protein [Candidatus Saccharimonadales bacterium]